jgi:hypothetical protein
VKLIRTLGAIILLLPAPFLAFAQPTQLSGPPYSLGMDLGTAVFGKSLAAPFQLRATADRIQALVGQSVYAEISQYEVGSNPRVAGNYVVEQVCQPYFCTNAARIVFDHHGSVWVATTAGQGWTWYGNPPVDVVSIFPP